MSHYIVVHQREEDGRKCGMSLLSDGRVQCFLDLSKAMKFHDADSASTFADYCEVSIGKMCRLELVRDA